MAEAGINDELKTIAANFGSSTVTGLSDQPAVGTGETKTYPGDSHLVYGRKGTLSGTDGNYWCFASNDAAGTTGWDGKTSPFYITSSAYVDGDWRRVKIKASGGSIFTLYAMFAIASYSNSSPAIGLSNATATINGTMGTNWTISNSSSTLQATNAINANTGVNPSPQFSTTNLINSTTGVIYSQSSRVVFPLTVSVMQRLWGLSSATDPFTGYLSTHNNNSTGVYTFKTTASSTTINATNCQQLSGGVNQTLTNSSSGSLGSWANAGTSSKKSTYNISKIASTASTVTVTLTGNATIVVGQYVTIQGVTANSVLSSFNGSWQVASVGSKTFTVNASGYNGTKWDNNTGTATLGVKALIFEPGDYYFTSINCPWNNQTELYIDPYAYATGGTAGQVRFFLCDTANGVQNDQISLQIQCSGTLDPSLFRIYVGLPLNASGNMKETFTFSRPSNATDYLGNTITGNFKVYGGVYAVTNNVSGGSSNLTSTINFQGTSSDAIELDGSLIADSVNFQGNSVINFISGASTNDPNAYAVENGSYVDGG